MSETINVVDTKNFEVVQVVTKTQPYNLDDLFAQLTTLHQRVAQIITNTQDQLRDRLTPSLNDIAVLMALLSQAKASGVDITPPATLLTSDVIVASVATLANTARDIASPPQPATVDPVGAKDIG